MNILLLVFLEEKTHISQFVPGSAVSPSYSVMHPNLLFILSANFFFEKQNKKWLSKFHIPNNIHMIVLLGSFWIFRFLDILYIVSGRIRYKTETHFWCTLNMRLMKMTTTIPVSITILLPMSGNSVEITNGWTKPNGLCFVMREGGGQLKWRISKDENRTVVCLTSQPHKPSTTGPSLEAVQQVASSPVLLMSENLEHFIQVFVKIKTLTHAEILADKSKESSCFGNIWQGGSSFGRDLNLVILNGILRKVLDEIRDLRCL